MQILKWLLVNWDSVLLIAMVVALIIYLIKTGQTKILKQIAIKFVTDAEGECGAGTGIIKLSEVVEKMYAYLPSVVRILFTEKQLVQIAESVLAEAKKKWEANENLTTYIENKQQTTPAVVPYILWEILTPLSIHIIKLCSCNNSEWFVKTQPQFIRLSATHFSHSANFFSIRRLFSTVTALRSFIYFSYSL